MPQTMIDIFSGDAFSSVTLTNLVNQNFPFVPNFLTSLNLAPAEGMLTLDAAFDKITGGIRMISATPRGAPPSQSAVELGQMMKLPSVHLSREVEVNADELLNARAFGSLDPQTLQNLILRRTDGPTGLKMQLMMTNEHMLMGAVDGVVYDADNATILYDFFASFGVARPAPVVIKFNAVDNTDQTDLIGLAMMGIRRRMVRALNGMAIGGARLIILGGDNFFDALISSRELVKARQTAAFGQANAANTISQNYAFDSVVYAGATWVNYRGTDDGIVSVPTNEARAFLAGVPGLFQTMYAPADTFETVSAIGLPFYLLNNFERQTSKRAVFELQSNPLLACLRPNSLQRITFA